MKFKTFFLLLIPVVLVGNSIAAEIGDYAKWDMTIDISTATISVTDTEYFLNLNTVPTPTVGVHYDANTMKTFYIPTKEILASIIAAKSSGATCTFLYIEWETAAHNLYLTNGDIHWKVRRFDSK